ncbi:MAG: caspase domain-containing protein [Vicinamibacterales bacterium]
MARKALLVGINRYPDPRNNLRGCVNDVLQTSEVLRTRYGFDGKDAVRLLTDERATSEAIRRRLAWLVDGARSGDVLVFQYSGHGSQVRDRDGDELADGLDEIICPYDHDWDSPFTDDELGRCVGEPAEGVNVTVILDCCHAGTGLRDWVPPIPVQRRSIVPPPDIRHRENLCIEDLGPNRSQTFSAPREELTVTRFGKRAAEHGAVLIAACASQQGSADAWIEGDFHGALTWYLWRAAAEGGYRLPYRDLIRRTRKLLGEARFEQVPQLEGEAPRLLGDAFAPIGAVMAA